MYKFTYAEEDNSVDVTMNKEDCNWDEVTETYFSFLKACTYIFPKGAIGFDLVFDTEENELAYKKGMK